MAKVPWEFESQPLTEQVHNLMIRVSERDKTIENQAKTITQLLAKNKEHDAELERVRKEARRRGIEFAMEQIFALYEDWEDNGWPDPMIAIPHVIHAHLLRYRDE